MSSNSPAPERGPEDPNLTDLSAIDGIIGSSTPGTNPSPSNDPALGPAESLLKGSSNAPCEEEQDGLLFMRDQKGPNYLGLVPHSDGQLQHGELMTAQLVGSLLERQPVFGAGEGSGSQTFNINNSTTNIYHHHGDSNAHHTFNDHHSIVQNKNKSTSQATTITTQRAGPVSTDVAGRPEAPQPIPNIPGENKGVGSQGLLEWFWTVARMIWVVLRLLSSFFLAIFNGYLGHYVVAPLLVIALIKLLIVYVGTTYCNYMGSFCFSVAMEAGSWAQRLVPSFAAVMPWASKSSSTAVPQPATPDQATATWLQGANGFSMPSYFQSYNVRGMLPADLAERHIYGIALQLRSLSEITLQSDNENMQRTVMLAAGALSNWHMATESWDGRHPYFQGNISVALNSLRFILKTQLQPIQAHGGAKDVLARVPRLQVAWWKRPFILFWDLVFVRALSPLDSRWLIAAESETNERFIRNAISITSATLQQLHEFAKQEKSYDPLGGSSGILLADAKKEICLLLPMNLKSLVKHEMSTQSEISGELSTCHAQSRIDCVLTKRVLKQISKSSWRLQNLSTNTAEWVKNLRFLDEMRYQLGGHGGKGSTVEGEHGTQFVFTVDATNLALDALRSSVEDWIRIIERDWLVDAENKRESQRGE